MNISDDYNSFRNCTDNENDDNIMVLKYLLLSISSGVKLLSLISSITYTALEALLTNK